MDGKIESPTRLRLLIDTARAEIGLVLCLMAIALSSLMFLLLAERVTTGATANFDRAVITALSNAGATRPVWLQELGRDVTALGSFVVLGILSATIIGYLLLVGMRAQAGLMAIAVLGGTILSNVLKMVFERPRPDIAHAVPVFTSGFPSSHAALSAIVFLTIGALLTRTSNQRRVKAYFISIAIVLTILVGSSRIYLGVHYPTDVLAGWCVGSAWAVLCWTVAVVLQRKGAVEPVKPNA